MSIIDGNRWLNLMSGKPLRDLNGVKEPHHECQGRTFQGRGIAGAKH